MFSYNSRDWPASFYRGTGNVPTTSVYVSVRLEGSLLAAACFVLVVRRDYQVIRMESRVYPTLDCVVPGGAAFWSVFVY
ncbi:hypothetical protein D3C75_1143750 [compost metagenome]